MNDRQLSPHFSFYQLTATNQADMQGDNRNVSAEEERKLCEVANLLEKVWTIAGCDLDVHSGRRCLGLNRRVGGSNGSQHLKCEAADISPFGPDTEWAVADLWQKIATAARAGKLKFGQLLLENASDGREGRKFWVHISLGAPYRDSARCGEIATISDGKFTLISKIV